MGGVFSFLGGLLSLGASAGLGIKEDMELEAKNREYRSHNYNMKVQYDYDYDDYGIFGKYDYEKVTEEILKDYPNMTGTWQYKIAKAAVAKRLMESETPYEYCPSDEVKMSKIDISKYATDATKINGPITGGIV